MRDWQRIELERTGGLAGAPVRVHVEPGDADAARFSALLDGVDLGHLEGTTDPAGAAVDGFSYALTIEAGGAVHDLRCDERALPEAVRPLVRALVRRGRERPRS